MIQETWQVFPLNQPMKQSWINLGKSILNQKQKRPSKNSERALFKLHLGLSAMLPVKKS